MVSVSQAPPSIGAQLIAALSPAGPRSVQPCPRNLYPSAAAGACSRLERRSALSGFFLSPFP